MADLIKELKDEHQQLASMLEDVQMKGIASPEGREELFKIKEQLLAHLKKEDERLYPPLKEEAQNDEQLRTMLNSYIDQMTQISKKALAFFEKYEGSQESSVDFYRDVGELIGLLKNRISKEENVLFARYEKLQQAKDEA